MPVIGSATDEIAQRRRLLPGLRAGNYFLPINPGLVSTDTFPAGNLYLVPWLLEQSVTIARVGVDVNAAAGAGTVVRPAVYADDGTGYPGALLLDAGTIPADVVAVQDLTVSLSLTPGLYWIGCVGQGAAVNLRSAYGYEPVIPIAVGTAIPDPGLTPLSYFMTSVPGALPSTFSASVQSNYRMPRLHMRVA